MNTSIRIGGAAALAAACLLSACAYFDRAPSDSSSSSRPAADVGAARLAAADGEPGNWMTHGGTYQEQRFSRLDRINQDNVGRLGLAWTYKLDLDRGVEATPIVVDGVMYTTGPFSMVYALDAQRRAAVEIRPRRHQDARPGRLLRPGEPGRGGVARQGLRGRL